MLRRSMRPRPFEQQRWRIARSEQLWRMPRLRWRRGICDVDILVNDVDRYFHARLAIKCIIISIVKHLCIFYLSHCTCMDKCFFALMLDLFPLAHLLHTSGRKAADSLTSAQPSRRQREGGSDTASVGTFHAKIYRGTCMHPRL